MVWAINSTLLIASKGLFQPKRDHILIQYVMWRGASGQPWHGVGKVIVSTVPPNTFYHYEDTDMIQQTASEQADRIIKEARHPIEAISLYFIGKEKILPKLIAAYFLAKGDGLAVAKISLQQLDSLEPLFKTLPTRI